MKLIQAENSESRIEDETSTAGQQNAVKIANKGKNLDQRIESIKANISKETAFAPIEEIQDEAKRFKRDNPQFNEIDDLPIATLRNKFQNPPNGPEDILNGVLKSYPEPFLANQALELLLKLTSAESKYPNPLLHQNVQAAKDMLNSDPIRKREIEIGKNIGAVVQEGAASGLGAAASLRESYHNMIATPPSPTFAIDTFVELANKYPSYKELDKTSNSSCIHSALI